MVCSGLFFVFRRIIPSAVLFGSVATLFCCVGCNPNSGEAASNTPSPGSIASGKASVAFPVAGSAVARSADTRVPLSGDPK